MLPPNELLTLKNKAYWRWLNSSIGLIHISTFDGMIEILNKLEEIFNFEYKIDDEIYFRIIQIWLVV